MKAALYARVSSEKQAEKDLSIPAQLAGLKEYAHKRGWEIHKEYVDEAKSARTANRPQFQEMIATAKLKSKPFNVILVWKFSRFARNREDSIIYKSLLRKQGVEVVSINEQIDDSPSGKMLEGIVEVMDEFYSANLSQDTIRGMKENARRGYLNGGSIPYGYKKIRIKVGTSEKSTLVIDEEHAHIVKQIFELCIQGYGAKLIAEILNSKGYRTRKGSKWETNGLRYILWNETYTGVLVFNRTQKNSVHPVQTPKDEIIRVENAYPVIIDREIFFLAQKAIEARSPKFVPPATINSPYILSTLLKCPECGSSMVGAAAKGSTFFYYSCRNHQRRAEHGCSQKSISKPKLEKAVFEHLKNNILTLENLKELAQLTKEEIALQADRSLGNKKDLDAQIETVNEKLRTYYDSLETGKLELDDLAPRIKELRAQITQLEGERDKVTGEGCGHPSLDLTDEELRRYVQKLQAFLEEKSPYLERKNFLKGFIKRVEYNKVKGGMIEYSFPFAQIATGEKARIEVLHFNNNGGVDGARTRDLVRDRHAL